MDAADKIAKAQEKLADALSKEPQRIPFQIRCQEVWIRAWVAVAGAEGVTSPDTPTKWANQCVKDFTEKFKSET